MSLINVSNLSFTYEGSYDSIFENVSFQLDTDWKTGFTGRNGRGKTTFLKLLLGKYEYSGEISANVSFEYFPYEVADPELTAIEVLENICPDLQYWQIAKEFSALEMDEAALYRPFVLLSNGERTKAMLAAMFLKENSFLLIDEPTNHLDMRGRELVGKYLNSKKGFILVSHDRSFLDGCTDHTLSINRTNIEVQRGSFSSWLANKERQDSFEIAENNRLKKEISRLRETSREKSTWSDRVEKTKFGGDCPDRGYAGHKSAKMMKRAKTMESRSQSAMEEKSKLLKNIESSEELKIHQLPFHSARLALLKDVSITYGSTAACSGVSFSIERGDRIALTGKNGSGKSSILKLICGGDIPHTGLVEVASGLKISYVPQDASDLSGSLSNYCLGLGIDNTLFRTILRKLDFSRDQFEKSLEQLSAGQKKKILIAGSLCQQAHLHIWDEPMNYIDVISRMQIEELLLKFQPTILFVEHDRAFVEKTATRVVEL